MVASWYHAFYGRDAVPLLKGREGIPGTIRSINPDQAEEFLRAIHEYGRVRRRDGALRWGVYRDVEGPDGYVETFLVSSWAEHLRQHERPRTRYYPRRGTHTLFVIGSSPTASRWFGRSGLVRAPVP